MRAPPKKRHHGAPWAGPLRPSLRRLFSYLALSGIWAICQTVTIRASAEPGAAQGPAQAPLPSGIAAEEQSPPDAEEAAQLAKKEFLKGNDAYERGQYREAAEAFERAHHLSPHSAVLFNAARAWWKMGESERAADDYAAAISRGELTSEQTLRARGALSNLRKKLGWIIVTGPDDAKVSVGHKEDSPLPVTAHLTPGDHVLVVERAGETWEQIVTIQADSPLSVVAKRLYRAAPASSVAATPDPPPTSNRQRNWGWFTLGLGGAFSAGAVVTGALTLHARDRFDSLNDGTAQNISAAEAQRLRAKQLRAVTNVLAFTGGATALTGLTLVLTAPRRTSARRSGKSVLLALGANRVELQGSF